MSGKDKQKIAIKKKKNSQDADEDILQEVIKTIDSLFEARLVEKIVRPIDIRAREEQIDKYGAKLQQLHIKLAKIKTEIVDMALSQNNNGRNKSVLGEATNKPDDWKKIIRNIESRYTQVLTDGSFKHFNKVVNMLNLHYNKSMQLINIEEWAASCLDTKLHESCC